MREFILYKQNYFFSQCILAMLSCRRYKTLRDLYGDLRYDEEMNMCFILKIPKNSYIPQYYYTNRQITFKIYILNNLTVVYYSKYINASKLMRRFSKFTNYLYHNTKYKYIVYNEMSRALIDEIWNK